MSYTTKLKSIIDELSKGLLEREEAVKLILLACFSGKSIFLYGPPGTAKSMIARRSASAFGENSSFFTYLMNRFSTPEEVFGPIDIKALKENKLKRVTKGYLPQANFAFLDEIWKSSPAILNTLLTIINEKIYQDGGENICVPLYGLICASNEFPTPNQGLEALYDRMLIRYHVLPLKESKNFQTLLNEESSQDFNQLKQSFSLDELEDIYLQSQKVKFSDEAMELICEIKAKIELYNQSLENPQDMIYVSDRRYKQIAQLLKVSAFLNDREEILGIDLALLQHCLWSTEKDKLILDQILKESFQKNIDNEDFIQLQNYISNLDLDITQTCYTTTGKAKKVNEEIKNTFIKKLHEAQKYLYDIEKSQQEEYQEEKNKNQNLFLDEKSHEFFLNSYIEIFENIAQEKLKIEQLLYNLENLEEISKNTSSHYLYTPTTKNQLLELIRHPNVNLADIDISNISDLSEIFKECQRDDFSGLEKWNVAHVSNMAGMFYDCKDFDHDISNWDVSSVTNMSCMFYGTKNFNQPLDNWDVSSVTNMSCMFYEAENFNQPLDNWDVSSVTNMASMFCGAFHFNQPLDNWDVSSVTDMSYMFCKALNFNQPLDNWNVSSVTNMASMFCGALNFNQPLNNWDVSSVTDMSRMFSGDIAEFGSWPRIKVTKFNQPLPFWDVSNVTNMSRMFLGSSQSPLPLWFKE
ncbi:BspA family leucine-rich repeat surface protein [Campylobacter jejuni]|nr:BspA family leucine-rich repeat surface protein [Campylobacter jejuni]EAJ7141388.1 BspA family leucine-rich repeat surface protein [Campylobacter jejuni]